MKKCTSFVSNIINVVYILMPENVLTLSCVTAPLTGTKRQISTGLKVKSASCWKTMYLESLLTSPGVARTL